MAEVKQKKRPIGRPTKYRPEYCTHVLRVIGEEGMPDVVAAGELGCSVEVFYDWEQAYPEFLHARKKAGAMRARKHFAATGMSEARWIFLAKNWLGLVDRVDESRHVKMELSVSSISDSVLEQMIEAKVSNR